MKGVHDEFATCARCGLTVFRESSVQGAWMAMGEGANPIGTMRPACLGVPGRHHILACCDSHNRNCEPPSELCCGGCTEVHHAAWTDERGGQRYGHPRGEECSVIDLNVTPRPEARVAAAWWAAKLGNAIHDNGTREPGEAGTTALANFAATIAGRVFTSEERDRFAVELAVGIEANIRRWGGWDLAIPMLASALRTIGTDYHADQVIDDAAERAHIPLRSFDLPMKTTMWVNPGIVRVGEGYQAEPVTVWQAEAMADELEGDGNGAHG